MDMTTVYAKTAKGQDEISSRANKLGHKLRLVLILVDGKLSVAEHQAKAGALGDVVSLMAELERGGFIERLGRGGATAPAAPGSTAAPAPVAPAGPGLPLPELRQKLNKLIHDYLGPDGDAFTEKIENCRTREEVRAYYASVQVAFREILGRRRSEELNARCTQWLG